MPKGEFLQYGGQAIIEGVMMRSPRFFAVAVRAPNSTIVLQSEPLEKTWIGKQKWLMKPFLRGTFALLDAMTLGYKAMQFASRIQMNPEYQDPDKAATTKAAKHEGEKINSIHIGGAMVVGLLIGVALFSFTPNLIAEQARRIGVESSIAKSYIAEGVRIVFLLGYLGLIGLMGEIRRVFQYHGAEHKAINAFEAEQPLTVENCRAQTRLHPRCGTSFAIIVLLVSLLLFPLVPRYPVPGLNDFLNTVIRVGVELIIMPIIAGISYELIRFAGRFKNQAFVKVLFWPGLMSQYLSTREPTDDQIEVAITALQACIDAENPAPASEPTPVETPQPVAG